MIILVTIFAAVAAVASFVLMWVFRPVRYTVNTGLSFEVKSNQTASALISEISDGEMTDPDAQLNTATIGEHTSSIELTSAAGIKETVDVSYSVVDTTPPVIEGEDEITVYRGSESNIKTEFFMVTDNYDEEVQVDLVGDYNYQAVGEYELGIKATDKSGNEAIKNFKLNVVVDPNEEKAIVVGYYIKVNRRRNVVMVYGMNKDGELISLVRTMVSSVGRADSETPLGKFTVSDRYETLYLVGNVWGRYATRINGPYFFHSVPYFTKGNPHWDNLEYLEYNKLGEPASAGCVRLPLADAVWIYQNVKAGTVVEIYDDNNLPAGVEQPAIPARIDVNDTVKRGWEPADWDSASPWN